MKILILTVSIFFVFQSNTNADIANKKYFKFFGKIKNEVFYDEDHKAIKYDYIRFNQKKNLFLENEGEYFKNVDKVQLNYLDKNFRINYNKNVELICKEIYSADSIFHYTDVICVVDSIKYNK